MPDDKAEIARRLPFSDVGGAPIVDFVNTTAAGGRGVVDRLEEYSDLVSWAAAFDLVAKSSASRLRSADGTAASRAAFASAIALRKDLRAAFVLAQRKKPAGHELRRRINRALADRTGRLSLDEFEDGYRIEFAAPVLTPPQFLAVISQEAARFLASGDLERVRPCKGANCILWFVDRTRNRSRHWCRMDRCGARAKAASYYRRRKRKA